MVSISIFHLILSKPVIFNSKDPEYLQKKIIPLEQY